ncbi:decorin-like [Periplaneta americana]|uniref:decorin-like n=1 Tax=Periplaneta americana TaxID=6978 RepID=UPI0037E96003
MTKVIAPCLMVFTVLCLCCCSQTYCPHNCECVRRETSCWYASLSSVPQTLSEDTIKLNLTYNNIQTLRKNETGRFPSLKIALLLHNHIATLESQIFCMAKELSTLDLSKNEIKYIDHEAFNCLQKLQRLYLNDNQIYFIESHLFKDNSVLTMLDLGNNNIGIIDSYNFQYNHFLTILRVENNPIILYPPSVYFSVTPFNVLDINFCNLKYPSLISFQNISRLEDLRYNINIDIAVTDFLSQADVHSNIDLMNVFQTKLRQIGYNLDDYINYNSTISAVTTSSNIPVLCYCDSKAVWFWCSEQLKKCPRSVRLEDMYQSLACYRKRSELSDDKNHDFDPGFKNSEIDGEMILYVSAGAILLTVLVLSVIIGLLIVRRRRMREREETGSICARSSFVYKDLHIERIRN